LKIGWCLFFNVCVGHVLTDFGVVSVGEWLYLIDLTFGLYGGLCSIPSRGRFLLNFNNPFKLIKLVLIKRQVGNVQINELCV
jgi:hypothetical protein